MDIFSHPIVQGIISFGLLSLASYCVGEGGEILGKKYDASVIGGLLIAWLNTAPETIFFISALRAENPRFAVGAVSGSTIVVSTVAIGVCLYLGSRARKGSYIRLQPAVKAQALILGFTTIIPLLTAIFGFSQFLSVLGIGSYVVFLVYTLVFSKRSSSNAERLEDVENLTTDHKKQKEAEFSDDEDDADNDDDDEDAPIWKGVAYLVTGGILIFVFSEPFINSVSSLATSLNVNPTLLAFFLAPIASEMPEILESISLSIKGNAINVNIAFSNLIGGTITKTTLLMGIFSAFGISKQIAWESPNYTVSLLMMILCAGAAALIGYFVSRQTRTQAYILFAIFAFTCIVQYFYNSTFNTKLEIQQNA